MASKPKPSTSMTEEPTAVYHKGSGETYVQTPLNAPGIEDDPRPVEQGWHQITQVEGLLKWQYEDSPYRVIADLGPRGHWRALFTSAYGGSYLIRGNCGGGEGGMMKATIAAQRFMKENEYGCPPPNEYDE